MQNKLNLTAITALIDHNVKTEHSASPEPRYFEPLKASITIVSQPMFHVSYAVVKCARCEADILQDRNVFFFFFLQRKDLFKQRLFKGRCVPVIVTDILYW